MKWYWWLLIAVAIILTIVFVVRSTNKTKLKAATIASSSQGFNPFQVVPIA